MIKLIPDLPHPVLGIRAEGKVTSSDYRSVFVPAVNEKLTKNAKIRLLYQLGDDFENYELTAMWEDAKMGASTLFCLGKSCHHNRCRMGTEYVNIFWLFNTWTGKSIQ